jgi:hypothetical protein
MRTRRTRAHAARWVMGNVPGGDAGAPGGHHGLPQVPYAGGETDLAGLGRGSGEGPGILGQPV